jgi:glycosyltransferase involved in cell wall biosynthesis
MMIHCDGLGDLALVRNRQLPTVCFCHTPLRPAFDEAYRKRVAPKYRGVLRPAFEASRIAFKLVDQRLWQRYSHVLFNSNETRRRAENGGLLRNLGGNHAILHPGIDWDAFQPSWDYKKYFFVPGRIMWTKNIELAIEAYRGFVKRCPNSGFRLVIAGRVDAKSRPYAQALRGRCAELPDVQFIENPSDDALFRLYRDCYSVLFPPFNEDWGMVPLEANAFGKPVIAVDAGGPRESQVPGRTGLLVPAEASAFCQAMVLLAENEELVRRMGRTGRVHARTYDWSHFVGAIDTLCEQLLGTGLSPVPTLAAEEAREGTEAWT